MGTAIPSRSVCGDAELVVRSSGCHRAGDGDQDTLSEHQKNPPVGEMERGPNFSEYEPFRGPRMERPAELVPRDPGEVLMENTVARTYLLRRADFERWGLSEVCPGCRYLRTGQGRQQAHSEACRRRIEGLLKGDPSGSARLAAADERINHALADAVERHAAKDPVVRGILKRASAACHPKSESRKKIALDTEQDSTPRPSVSYGGSSASGTRPSTATRTAQDADTSDVTRGTGPELAPGMIQPSSSDDTGGDAVMEGENADERSATDSNPSGPDSRRRIMTKTEPREARDEQSIVTSQHIPRRMSGKTTPQGHAVAVKLSPRRRHWTGLARKP